MVLHKKSHDMEKQVVALQEMLKTHNSNVIRTIGHSTNTAMQSSQYAKQLEATILQAVGQHKGLEKLGEGLTNVLAGIKVLQNQLGESPPASTASENVAEICPRSCPDDSAIAEHILTTILRRNSTSIVGSLDTDVASAAIADKLLSTLKCTQTADAETGPNMHDLSPVTEAHIERIVERTLEVYKNNSNADTSKTHDHDLTEDKVEETGAESSRVDARTSSSECPNGTDNRGGTNGQKTDAINNGKVLDIPANEEHMGETLEYNVTSEDASVPIQPIGPNANGTVPTDANNVELNQTYPERINAEVEHGDIEPNHMTNIIEDYKTAKEESDPLRTDDEQETVAGNASHPDEDEPSNENGTEMPSDYDFDKTSSELDRSEQLYYDEMTDGGFEDESGSKTSDVGRSGNHTAETPHPANTTSAPGPDGRTVRPDARMAQGLIESAFEVSVQILKSMNSSVGRTSGMDKARAMNTTKDDSLEKVKNDSDIILVNPVNKPFNQTDMQNTTANLQTTDPVFSKFWHRIVSVASSNESAENTQGDLSRNVDPDKTEPGELKGQGVEGNVNAESLNANVTDNRRDARDETNDLESEQEHIEEMHDDLFEEFGSYVPPSR